MIIYIIGRPNVGKSTLCNKLATKKYFATSHKSFTTRKLSDVVIKLNNNHYHLVDVPGGFIPQVLPEDTVVYCSTPFNWDNQDLILCNLLASKTVYHKVLVINKSEKKFVRDIYQQFNLNYRRWGFDDLYFISAKSNLGLNLLKSWLVNNSISFSGKVSPYNDNLIIKEIIREQLIRYYGDEIPYVTEIVITANQPNNLKILLVCHKLSHLPIIIGSQGNRINFLRDKLKLVTDKDIVMIKVVTSTK